MLREDYPNPAFIRPRWKSLNGSWGFSRKSKEPLFYNDLTYEGERIVPDNVGENLGAGNIAYKSFFWVSEADIAGTVFIKMQEVYGDLALWINDVFIVRKMGFSQTFTIDITPNLRIGKNSIVVHLANPSNCSNLAPLGLRGNVWIEIAAKSCFEQVIIRSSIGDNSTYLSGKIINASPNLSVTCELSFKEKTIANYNYDAKTEFNIQIPIPEPIFYWEELEGNLYDIKVTLKNANGGVCDVFHSYVGLKRVGMQENSMIINGKPVFLKLVKDSKMQTKHIHCPMKIRQFLSSLLALGFNGIDCSGFEPTSQFIYLADRLGIYILHSLLPNDLDMMSLDYTMLSAAATSSILRNTGSPSITLCSLNSHVEIIAEIAQKLFESILKIRNDILISTYSPSHIIGHFLSFPLKFQNEEQSLRDIHSVTSSSPTLIHFGFTSFAGAYSPSDTEILEEREFLEKYHFITRAILASNALGFSYNALFDAAENHNGLYLASGDNKLSRNGQLSFIKSNEQRSIHQLNYILKENTTV